MNRLLQYAFMCHRIPERSFFYRGKQFPLCARCTGILCGYIIGLLILKIYAILPLTLSLIIIIPMIIDGTGQLFNKWESNNFRRLITGILGGISIDFLIINFTLIFINYGRQVGQFLLS